LFDVVIRWSFNQGGQLRHLRIGRWVVRWERP
jgi:hypothetical protein